MNDWETNIHKINRDRQLVAILALVITINKTKIVQFASCVPDNLSIHLTSARKPRQAESNCNVE
jgi:hypothetical protein